MGIIFHGDAFRPGQWPDDDIHFILLDELACCTQCAVRAGIRRNTYQLDLFTGHAVIPLIQRKLYTTHAVLAKNGEPVEYGQPLFVIG